MHHTLPQHDPEVGARAAELRRAKETFRYDRSIEGLLFAAEVPASEMGGAVYWARLAEANLEVSVNRVVTTRPVDLAASAVSRLASLVERLVPDRFHDTQEALHAEASAGGPHHRVAAPDAFRSGYGPLRAPDCLDTWSRDDRFAWRAIAGDYPVQIRRLTAPLTKLPVDDAAYQRIVGPGDSLEKAMAEGRLYVIDHASFDGLPGGSVDGYPKVLDAPIGLYAWSAEKGWVVVGIQVGQDPTRHRFFQPGDGVSWRMARVSHAVADSHAAGLVGHFGLCHVVMEGVALACRRTLADRHPLRALLDAHTAHTLIVNRITRDSLTPVGGGVDRLMSLERLVSLRLTREAVEAFRIMDSAPPEEFERRGVDDPVALPLYPYRDDQLRLWGAVSDWVDGYVRAWYRDDAAVLHDGEVQDFVAELQDPTQGGLVGIGPVETVARLTHLLARVVFRATAFHAAINYALYDEGYAALEPTAQYGPGPTGADSEEDWVRMYPPVHLAYEAIASYYPLQVQVNRLGDYGDALSDPRVRPSLEAYRSTLEGIEQAIAAADATRPFRYLRCLPSRVSNSVHV